MLARIPAGGAELRAVVPKVGTSSLVEAAARHGLSAILADALARAQTSLNGELQERLLGDARAQVGQGFKTRRLTLAVVDELARSRVTPVMLKGYALAVRLFPEQPLARPSTDVDILVSPEDLPRVREALARLQVKERVDASLGDVFEEHHHIAFAGPPGLVEVHFRLFTGFGRGTFDDRAVWARSRLATIDGRSVRLLSPEDEFVYLATHAANHAFLRASWLVDLERYLALHPALDWAAMSATAHAAGFHAAVSSALALLELLLDVHLPSGAAAAFRVGGLRRLLSARLFSASRVESAELSGHRLWSFLLRLALVDSPSRGLRHVLDGARRFIRQARAEG